MLCSLESELKAVAVECTVVIVSSLICVRDSPFCPTNRYSFVPQLPKTTHFTIASLFHRHEAHSLVASFVRKYSSSERAAPAVPLTLELPPPPAAQAVAAVAVAPSADVPAAALDSASVQVDVQAPLPGSVQVQVVGATGGVAGQVL